MVVPRRRSTPTTVVEPSKDTTKTKVVLEDEGNVADIVEQIGGKTVAYQARVKEDDTKDDTEDFNDKDIFEDLSEDIDNARYPLPQKSDLDKAFDDVQFAVEHENVYDTFFAKLVRQPDAINDKFNTPCRDLIEVGVIQFSTHDRFNFIPAIQDANNDSGGRFTVSIYTSDYKPLQTMNGMSYRPRPVGFTLYVANPKPKPLTTPAGSMDVGTSAVLGKMVELMQQNHNQLRELLTQRPQKSTIEMALENALAQKLSNDIINPPQNKSNGIEDTMNNILQSAVVMGSMGEALGRAINREPTPPPEPDIVDKINKVFDMPVAKELASRLMDIGDAMAVKNLNLGANAITSTEQIENLEQANNTPNLMQELTVTIIDELESDNPLNADNQTILELREDFPNEFSDLQVMCKTAPFETVFSLLLNRASKMQPFPFTDYLDLTATQEKQTYVWNEKGDKMISRLQALYEYLRTSD